MGMHVQETGTWQSKYRLLMMMTLANHCHDVILAFLGVLLQIRACNPQMGPRQVFHAPLAMTQHPNQSKPSCHVLQTSSGDNICCTPGSST